MEFGPILKTLRQRKAFTALIVIQIAITLTALTISVIVTMATLKEWNLPSGLDQENIVAVYPQIFNDKLVLEDVIAHDLETLKAIPGVLQVTTAINIPFSAQNVQDIYQQLGEDAQSYQTNFFDFDEQALDILGVKLLEGRNFTSNDVIRHNPEDSERRPAVVLISETMAEAIFEGKGAVGQSLYLEKDGYPVEIIGVYTGFMNGERLNYQGMSYRSVIRPLIEYRKGIDPNYLIRVEPGKTEAFLETIRVALYETQGRFIQGVEFLTRTQKRMYDGRGSRSLVQLVISFILLIITSLGTSGLISFLVAQQKKQIGTRRALGAKKWHIMRYYLLENSIVTWMGIAIGMLLSISMLILLADESGLELVDLTWLFIMAFFIWIVSLVSALYPSKRATEVPPAIVTRGA